MDQGPLLIRGGLAILPSGPARVDILCERGQIAAIGHALATADVPVLDATGYIVGPGFVDIHVHGGGGHSFFGRDPAAVRAYAAWAPRHGLTSFLVSTVGADADDTAASLSSLRSAVGAPGAEPLGFHLEGPFLSPARRGAFPKSFLLPPDADLFVRFQDAAGGHIRQVTLAPELVGAASLIEAVTGAGAIAAMGHTDATARQAREGFAAGIRHTTHLFNAMRPFHHRDAGPAIAALLDGSVTCELICDGLHVSPDVLRLAHRLLGDARFLLVTDNMALAGTPAVDDSFVRGRVTVRDGAAARSDGTLVGSVQPIDQQVRNAVEWLHLDPQQAFVLAATNPSRVAGVSHRKGAILPGMDADLVVLDQGWNVVATVCRGEVAYQAPG